MTGSLKRLLVPLIAGVLCSTQAVAQQSGGVVTGRVTAEGSGEPLSEARVIVVGSNVFASTSTDGRYTLRNVPAGVQNLRVIRVGYQEQRRPVTVTEGQTSTADFSLAVSVVRLSEVITTATGETQRRRETGNVVSTVEPTPERLATTTTISQLLTAKAPGVSVATSGGTTGSASRIRIRGASSVSLSNEPLLIIDGIRVNNEIAGTGTLGVGGQQSSRMNDINPDDIESLEIIKGPAAAALYGTAAANGVIQIRTKRGRAGRTRWTIYGEAGSQEDVQEYPANFSQIGTRVSNGARLTGCTLDAQARNVCTPKPDSLVSHNPLETYSPFIKGYRSSVGLNATGGSDVATYFISADIDKDQGIVEPNNFRRASLRANLTSQLRSNLTTQVFTNYISSRLSFPQNDNNILGVVSSGLLGSAFDNPTSKGYIAGQTPKDIFAIDTDENVERFVGSALTTWTALPWLAFTGQAGVDFLDRRNKETLPPNTVIFNQSTMEGSRSSNAAQIWNYTANGTVTATRDLLSSLRSSTTAGVQFTQEQVQGTRAFGAVLLAGTGSLQGTSSRFSVGETNTDNRTLGALLQQQFAWRDRLFVSAAARTDNNSAFGSNFGWILYPAASVSWVVSEEGFFPQTPWISSLRLRTAYGESGQRPSFRDAITYFNTQTVTVGTADVPGIVVGGTGNADLEPELSREVELGFELGLFSDRLGIDFTSYNKKTNNLLIARPLPPSLGLTGSQFANLGRSSNRGLELQVTSRILEMQRARLELDINASTNHNRIEDLGRAANGDTLPDIVFGNQRHNRTKPLGGYWDETYTFEDKNKDGIISRVNCPGQTQVAGGPACEITIGSLSYLGNPLPTREISFNPRLTLFQNIQFAALIDHKGGYKLFNNTARFRCNFGNCVEAYDKNATAGSLSSLELQARNLAHLMNTDAGYVEDADFTKLREISMSLIAPQAWAQRARVGELRLTIAGRNLATWTDYTGFDPEVNSTPTANFGTSDFLTQPPLRVFSARLTVSF